MKRPPLIPTVLVSAFVFLMMSLGFWQLDRAQQKERMLELMSNQKISRVFDETQLETLEKYAVVELWGQYDSRYQFLLDNQFYEKRVGYHVFTPFYLTDLEIMVLVNRGWVEKTSEMPRLKPVSAVQQFVKGRLTYPPKVGYQLGEIQLQNEAQQIITYYEEDKIQSFLKKQLCRNKNCKVSHRVLWLDPIEEDGFVRDWKPVIMPPEKHYGYAVQWFSMTFVLIVIFFIWLRKTKQI